MKRLLSAALMCYEILRTFVLLCLTAPVAADKLPSSYYAAAPLLLLPLLLLLLRIFDEGNAAAYTKICALSKMMGAIGLLAYLRGVDLVAATGATAILTNFAGYKRFLCMAFFFLSDLAAIALLLVRGFVENKGEPGALQDAERPNQTDIQEIRDVTCD